MLQNIVEVSALLWDSSANCLQNMDDCYEMGIPGVDSSMMCTRIAQKTKNGLSYRFGNRPKLIRKKKVAFVENFRIMNLRFVCLIDKYSCTYFLALGAY